MRGLTIVIADGAPERCRTALVMALAQRALDGSARIFFEADAVALLRAPIRSKSDAAHAAAGLPSLGELLNEALDAGVSVTACQSGLALLGNEATDFDERIDWGGLVGIMAQLADDRLVIA